MHPQLVHDDMQLSLAAMARIFDQTLQELDERCYGDEGAAKSAHPMENLGSSANACELVNVAAADRLILGSAKAVQGQSQSMSIGQYIKDIGRGKDGARPLNRVQAADLMGQVLDGAVTDLEVGAFCIAMRIKGETDQEMAGFLDATRSRMRLIPSGEQPCVVIPSYNGARKLPLLTPLLGLLLARQGLPVLIHGCATEDRRLEVAELLEAFGITKLPAIRNIANGELALAPTALLCPGLHRLLEVRRVVKLRNPAHSMVKLMNPCVAPSLLIGSYTHPEYAQSMAATLALTQGNALLLRGTEGEAVTDPRRTPLMQGFLHGQAVAQHEAQIGTLVTLPELPKSCELAPTVAYIRQVLEGRLPLPQPIAQQVQQVLHLHALLSHGMQTRA